MRIPTLILAVLAATLLVLPVRLLEGAVPANKDQTDESVKKLKELRQERIAVLKDLTDSLEALYKNARVEIVEVFEARQMLIEAELEASKTEAEHIELYKKLVVALKGYESWADEKFKAGRGTQASVLKAKAKRLEAEIHLEEAKMKVAKESK